MEKWRSSILLKDSPEKVQTQKEVNLGRTGDLGIKRVKNKGEAAVKFPLRENAEAQGE